MGERRKFSREFKLEAVRLAKDRGVSVAKAAARPGCSRERVAPVQTRAGERCATCIVRPRRVEALAGPY